MGEVISIRQDDAYLQAIEDDAVWAKIELDEIGITERVSKRRAVALAKQPLDEVIARAGRPFYLSQATVTAVIDTCMGDIRKEYSAL